MRGLRSRPESFQPLLRRTWIGRRMGSALRARRHRSKGLDNIGNCGGVADSLYIWSGRLAISPSAPRWGRRPSSASSKGETQSGLPAGTPHAPSGRCQIKRPVSLPSSCQLRPLPPKSSLSRTQEISTAYRTTHTPRLTGPRFGKSKSRVPALAGGGLVGLPDVLGHVCYIAGPGGAAANPAGLLSRPDRRLSRLPESLNGRGPRSFSG
jgi:hypothetical protein